MIISCPKCQTMFNPRGKWGLRKFCSISCANSRNRTEEFKKKLSEFAKSNPTGIILLHNQGLYVKPCTVAKINTTCIECGKIFEHRKTESRKYCSAMCRQKNAGGLRHGSGRGKSGYYQGFYLSSTYELAYLIYHLDHNIPIQRNKEFWEYRYKDKIHKFYPDFIVNGMLVELKNYRSELTDIKISAVTKPIKILYGGDLKEIFSYVETKTGLKPKDFHKLYES